MSLMLHLESGIYPIIDATWAERWAVEPKAVARAFAEAGIGITQLRSKVAAGEGWRFLNRWVEALRQEAPGVAIVVNDRADWAVAVGADGLHAGQEDLPPSWCRKVLGASRYLGLSTHTLDEVAGAGPEAVDYLGFGPVLTTHSKPDALPARGMDQLAAACRRSDRPVVAIGGIEIADLPEIRAAGASAAAMIGGWLQPDWRDRLSRAVAAWQL